MDNSEVGRNWWVDYNFYMLGMCIAFKASKEIILEMCNNVLDVLKSANLDSTILTEFLNERGYNFQVINQTSPENKKIK